MVRVLLEQGQGRREDASLPRMPPASTMMIVELPGLWASGMHQPTVEGATSLGWSCREEHPMASASLTQRNLQPEVMDQPGLDPVEHERALRALVRINLLSNTAGILWGPI